jgi:hypothetical protein
MRFDFIFSYWLFAWFLVHLVLQGPSPKFWLWFGVLSEMVVFAIHIFYHSPAPLVLFFVFYQILIKGIPLWMLRNETIRLRDVAAGVFLFLVYVKWLEMNGTTFVSTLQTSLQYIKDGAPSSPMAQLVFTQKTTW